MKVLIVVTHLLGTGHLARALTLARAFQDAGHTACVASGGMPAPHLNADGINVLQLPPVRSDGVDFATLLDDLGAPASDRYLEARTAALLQQLTLEQPDVLITELYPFGRRILRGEFDRLLQAAHAQPQRPLICASVRDILAPPSKPAKGARTDMMIADLYDAVLVHSVAALTPLSASWPVTDRMVPKLNYTGYVAPSPVSPDRGTPARGAIVVSAGGGDVGEDIYRTAIGAAKLQPDLKWHLLVGGKAAGAQIKNLRNIAPQNVTLEPANPAFRQMLHHARASVSMCGYNTALDLLQSGVPAVLIPFDAGGEVEQTLRANSLSTQDGVEVLINAALTPQALLASLECVTAAPRRAGVTQGMDGAAQTVKLTEHLRAGMV